MQQLGDGASTDSSWGDSCADKEEGGSGDQRDVVKGRHSPSNSSTSSSSKMDTEKMERREGRGGKVAPSDEDPSGDGSGEAAVGDNSNCGCSKDDGKSLLRPEQDESTAGTGETKQSFYVSSPSAWGNNEEGGGLAAVPHGAETERKGGGKKPAEPSFHDNVTGAGGNTNGVHQAEAKKSWVQGEGEEACRNSFPPQEEMFLRGSLSSALEYSGSGLMVRGCQEDAHILGPGDSYSDAAGSENNSAAEELPARGTAGNRAVPGQRRASDGVAALGDDSEGGAGDEPHCVVDAERSTIELCGVGVLLTSALTGDCDPLRSRATAGDGGGPARPTNDCTASNELVVGSFRTAGRDRGGDSETAAARNDCLEANWPPTTPARTASSQDSCPWSEVEKVAVLFDDEEERSLRHRLRRKLGSDRFLDACRWVIFNFPNRMIAPYGFIFLE